MTVYPVAYGGGMLLAGPLGSSRRRRLLIAGTTLFALASTLAAVANRIEVLLLARAAGDRCLHRHGARARSCATCSVTAARRAPWR